MNEKYSIIYADPPWQYEQCRLSGVAKKHYDTMSTDDICTLPVADIADKNAVLFLWVTFPQLPNAFRVIREWGFTFKTVAFVWIKLNRKSDSIYWGMGFWTRSNAEICILATRGKPKRIAANVHQVIMDNVKEHSRKPDEARKRIVELLGDIPRIELFSREKSEGWDVWGNEVDSDIVLSPHSEVIYG